MKLTKKRMESEKYIEDEEIEQMKKKKKNKKKKHWFLRILVSSRKLKENDIY